MIMYEIYTTQGQGEVMAGRVPTLNEAINYISDQEGCWAIKYPSGKWHEWKQGEDE